MRNMIISLGFASIDNLIPHGDIFYTLSGECNIYFIINLNF